MGYGRHRRTTHSASVAVRLQDRVSGRRFLPAHVGSAGRHCGFHCGEGHLYVCGGMDLAVFFVFVQYLYVCGGMDLAVFLSLLSICMYVEIWTLLFCLY